MVTAEENDRQIIQLTAQEATLEKALKDTHDNRILRIGWQFGYQEGLAEGKKLMEKPPQG